MLDLFESHVDYSRINGPVKDEGRIFGGAEKEVNRRFLPVIVCFLRFNVSVNHQEFWWSILKKYYTFWIREATTYILCCFIRQIYFYVAVH
jgi:hypothetical protein